MTLGELITALKAFDPSLPIDGDSVDSYRGYYEQLAVGPGESTVGGLLEECEAAVGATFQGYKGGEYVFDEATPVWFAEYGHSSGLAVVGVLHTGSRARLQAADISAYA